MGRVLPILFNTEMVQAILDGRKTVTRRMIKPQPIDGHFSFVYHSRNIHIWTGSEIIKPPYQPGDILYVRETWFYEHHMEDKTAGEPDLPSGKYSHRYIYKADNPDYPANIGIGATGWKPSIHMPKEAARIWLKVTDVRVERLQDITDEGILKEGLDGFVFEGEDEGLPIIARNRFVRLWNATIKKSDLDRYGWDTNPWVWVIEFKRCGKPEGDL